MWTLFSPPRKWCIDFLALPFSNGWCRYKFILHLSFMSKRGEREREKGEKGARRRGNKGQQKEFWWMFKVWMAFDPKQNYRMCVRVLRICVYLDDFEMKALWDIRWIENDIRLIGFDRVCIANGTSLLSHMHNSHISIYCVLLVNFHRTQPNIKQTVCNREDYGLVKRNETGIVVDKVGWFSDLLFTNTRAHAHTVTLSETEYEKRLLKVTIRIVCITFDPSFFHKTYSVNNTNTAATITANHFSVPTLCHGAILCSM